MTLMILPVLTCIMFIFAASGPTLTFDSVKKTDSGDYVCFAENVAGLTTSTVTLDVQCEYLQILP